jgi:hypothetical protein
MLISIRITQRSRRNSYTELHRVSTEGHKVTTLWFRAKALIICHFSNPGLKSGV